MSKGAAYDEIVEIVADGKEKKLGRIVEINEDKACLLYTSRFALPLNRKACGQWFRY